MSSCEVVGKPFLCVYVNVCVENLFSEEGAWYCVEGLTNVNCS